MKMPICLCLLAALFLAACDSKQSGAGGTTNSVANPQPQNALSDYGSALARGQNNAVKTVDLAALNQAVAMFNVDQGRFPKDLNELVEKQYMSKLPAAPRGMKLVYDAAAGKVSVAPQ
jgi:hypothetical protein